MQVSSVSISSYMQQIQQSLFKKADSDGDGSLSLDEFSAAGPAKDAGSANAAAKADKAAKLFKALDTDGDGQVSQSEMEALTSKLSSSTQSSLISLQQSDQGSSDPLSSLLSKADTDGDGSLSLDEFTAAKPKGASDENAAKVFADMDKDGDGKVSSDEISGFEEAHKAQGGGHAHHHGGGHMPPPDDTSAATDADGTTSLASVLSGTGSSDDSPSSLADILNKMTADAGTSTTGATGATADFSKQLAAYLQQAMSGYADQARSSTSSLNVAA